MSTKIAYPRAWVYHDYVKTTYVFSEDDHHSDRNIWSLVEEQDRLDTITEIGKVHVELGDEGIDGKCTKIVIMVHSNMKKPHGFRGGEEDKPRS